MKKLISLFLLLPVLALADGPVINPSPYMRLLIRAPDAGTARSILGILVTNGWPVTNITLFTPSESSGTYTNPINLNGMFVGGDFSGAAGHQKNQQNYLTNMIACWGDSITAGGNYGNTNWCLTYPFYLMALGGYTTTNIGIAGENTTSYQPTFLANSALWSCPAIVELGVNDHTQGETDNNWTNACMTNLLFMATKFLSVGNSNYIFCTIENGTNEPIGTVIYTNIANFNAMMKVALGSSHVFDMSAWLQSNYNPQIAQDVTDVGNHVTPWTLRLNVLKNIVAFPYVHLNPFGQEVLARGLLGTALNNWNQNAVTEATLRQNLALWRMNRPVFDNPYVNGQLNFVDTYLGFYPAAGLTVSNRTFTFNDDIGDPYFNVDYNGVLFNPKQAYIYGAPGWIFNVGYDNSYGPKPVTLFATNSTFYGQTVLPEINGSLMVSNISGLFANGISSLQSGLPAGSGNWWAPFLFGVKYANYDAVALQFYYQGDGSLANYWTPAFYGVSAAPYPQFYASGNVNIPGTITNAGQVLNGYFFTGVNDGLTAWYPFSDKQNQTNIFDYARGGNNAWIYDESGAASTGMWTNSAHGGGGLIFKGTNLVESSTGLSSFVSNSTYSCAFWFNQDFSTNSSGERLVCVCNHPSITSAGEWFVSFGIEFDNPGNPWGINFHNKTSAGETNVCYSANPWPSTNVWHHIGAVYDGVSNYLYLDGAQVAAVAQTGNNNNSGAVPLTLGGNPQLLAAQYSGMIDDVKYWNRALSAVEMLQVYNGVNQ